MWGNNYGTKYFNWVEEQVRLNKHVGVFNERLSTAIVIYSELNNTNAIGLRCVRWSWMASNSRVPIINSNRCLINVLLDDMYTELHGIC